MKTEMRITEDLAGKRLDQIIKIPDASRSRIQKAIRSGACSVDGEVITDVDFKSRLGQKITLDIQLEPEQLKPEEGDVNIIWQDADLVVCDKPADLTVHPCPSCPEHTLVQRLIKIFPQLAEQESARPGIAHRLDKDTSGLILIALNEKTRLALSEDFANRKINKQYLAVVRGVPPAQGECLEPIGRHPAIKTRMAIVPEKNGGRNARTTWDVLWHNERIALVSVRIYTGRTHQIRVHFSAMGYPIIGDQTYAPADVKAMAPRQMLHAWKIEFEHPGKGKEMKFTAPPPEDFFQAILVNSKTTCNIVVTGGMGCGKSTFCKKLAELGVPVISADDIVRSLYQDGSDVGHWFKMRGIDILKNNSVDKQLLFKIMQANAQIKKEYEQFIHTLVYDKIQKFWQNQQGALCTAAEIPLYFDRGPQTRFTPEPLTAGIHCEKTERWKRIRQNRGWSDEKIGALESWQMPEEKKMSLCDIIYDNTLPGHDLAKDAADLIQRIQKQTNQRQQKLLKHLQALCGCAN